MGGVVGAVTVVLFAATVVSWVFLFLKYRENKRLKQEIIQLDNEPSNQLLENDNGGTKQVGSEAHVMDEVLSNQSA